MTAPTQTAPPAWTQPAQVATFALEAAAAAKAVQLAIRAALLRDVVRLWPALDKNRLAETFPGWVQAMTTLVTGYHGQSAAAASSFYRAARAQAMQSPTPASLVQLAPPPQPEWVKRAFGFSGPGLLQRDTAQPGTALSTTLGTAARIVLDGGLTTVTNTAHADPAALGYFRITDGDPCAFCALLASRGIVYKQDSFRDSNKRFVGPGAEKVHNLCGCILAPAFSRKQALPSISAIARDVYAQSPDVANADSKDKIAAFRKAWSDRRAQSIPTEGATGTSRPPKAPKKAAPPAKPGRTAEQIRAELTALEKRLPTATAQQREWLTGRIATLRSQLGQ
ncbi:MAG: hypothetical protein HOV76_14640 [Hamadaea sp.]|nr:hypothetical protein [Hamadaea sp.]